MTFYLSGSCLRRSVLRGTMGVLDDGILDDGGLILEWVALILAMKADVVRWNGACDSVSLGAGLEM